MSDKPSPKLSKAYGELVDEIVNDNIKDKVTRTISG